MADYFEDIIKDTLSNEGGYQNLASDKGNLNSKGENIGTNFGISAPVLETYLQKVPSESDMRNLSLDTAKAIYKKNYYTKPNLAAINNKSLQSTVFDMGVNAGTGTAIKGLQGVVGAKQTGTIDDDTATKINFHPNQKSLFDKYQDWRKAYYKKIGGSFTSVWLKRVDKYKYAIGGIGIALLIGGAIAIILIYRKRKEIGKAIKKIEIT